MPNGDAAADEGMDVVPGAMDLRDGFDEINKTRDYLANHQTSGTHSADAITSGTIAEARLPALTEAKIPSGIPVAKINSGQWTGDIDTPWQMKTSAGVTAQATYAQSVAGMGGFRTMSVAANGIYGGLTSSRKFKRDIKSAKIARATLRKFAQLISWYRYKAVQRGTQGDEPLQLGSIAEDVHDLGLTFLVDYEDGEPYALVERHLPYLPMLHAEDAHVRIDNAEKRLAALESLLKKGDV